MIVIVDYGLGNVLAFANVYKRLNIAVEVAKTASELHVATKLILPGVGAFDHAMELLSASGMRETLAEIVLTRSVPVLGVCVGMQMLAEASEEGKCSGLGWIDGRVRRLDDKNSRVRLPHMGWNDVELVRNGPLFEGLETDSRFYFLHSYYFECARREDVLAEAEYGGKFSCAVQHKHVYGVQFHPEKSHRYGARLLKNFAEM